MKNISRFILIAVVAIVAGGAAFFSTWDIPAPVTTIEKVLPDDRFPR